MIRVLVANNSRIYSRLLAEALTRDPLLEVIPCDSDLSGLVATAMAEDIDVLVISSNLDEQPARGLEVLRELRVLHPDVRAVLLPDSSKNEAVLQAFRAGARGIFGRNEPIEMLSKCVRCVHQGQIWASSEALEVVLEALAGSTTVRAVNADGMNLLSERESQVVRCVAEGLTNREIAERLKLSQHTVKNHLFRVFDKLGVSNRVELLFMTLSQAPAERASLPTHATADHNKEGQSRHESDLLKKSAEAGLPAAQLALARLYLTRRSDPQDLVDAYMWYLIATESGMQAQGLVTNMMTQQQIDEAKQKASVWLSKRKQHSHSSAGIRPQIKPPTPGANDLTGGRSTNWKEELVS
jgi:DNA-binding NarL/FixJ family response regulator